MVKVGDSVTIRIRVSSLLVHLFIFADMVSGWILIDRCGKHFGTILNFLRDGTVPLPETRRELLELQKEAKYYLIEELVRTIEAQLTSQTQVDPICKVPLITSQKEEQALVGSTGKVSRFTRDNGQKCSNA